MSQQQILPLALDVQKTFEHFWVGTTQKLVVEKLQHLKGNETLFLWGASKHGLTHLAQATCDYWQRQNKHCLYFDLTELSHYQNMLPQALEGFDIVIFDHLESALNDNAYEEILFHCYNRLQQLNACMVFVAHQPPDALLISLADLKSRLNACLVLHLNSLSDDEKSQALINYAEQRGLFLSIDVAQYLLTHYSRDLKSLLHFMEKLDIASLRDQKRLTIPFIKKELEQQIGTTSLVEKSCN